MEDCIKNKDYVVHTAAHVSFHTGQRKKLYQINVEGTSNIVNACLKYPPAKLCYISSIATINKMSEASTASTLNEEAHWDSGEKHSDYANSKYLAEMEVWRAAAEELNVVILNPSTVLGQGYMNQNTGLLFDYVQRGNRFYTDGYINYVDVRDVATACFIVTTDQKLVQERYIINSGMITYQDFFNKIAQYMGKKAPNIYLPLNLVKTLIPIWNTLQWIFKTKGQIPLQAFSKGQQVFDYSTQKLTDTIHIDLKSLEETLQWVSAPNNGAK